MNNNSFNPVNNTNSLSYQSMVIRYWQEHHPTKGALWRCLVVNPRTGKQVGFKSFVELSNFLATMFNEEVGA